MFPTLVNVVLTIVIFMEKTTDGVTLKDLTHGIIVKLKRHSQGNHVVVRKFEKVQGLLCKLKARKYLHIIYYLLLFS